MFTAKPAATALANTMRSSHSPTIRSRYDYYYSSMSPASSAANFYDNQNQSLFGDPVPPSTDFLETLDNHLYGSLRRGSVASPHANDAFIDDFMQAQNSAHRLHIASGRAKDRSAPPGDTAYRDEFRYDVKRRSSSSFSDEFRANLDAMSESDVLIPTAPKRLFSEEPVNYRNLISIQSSDSQNGSSNEWIRPTTAFPRPASRNVMQIDHSSAMMGILPESTASSSDDNKSSSFGNVRQIQVLPYRKPSKSASTVIHARPNTNESSSEDYISSASPPKRDVSPAILTDTIKTGSDYRFQPTRLHKKTSFTIINELEPNQSRPASPSGGRASPFRGKGFRASSSFRSRPVSCPESPRDGSNDHRLSSSSHDDSQLHRPSVHFNIIPPIPRKRTAIKVIEATTTDENDNLDSVMDVSYQDRDMESFEMLSNGQVRTRNLSRRGSMHSIYPESPKTKPSPAPRRTVQRSVSNLQKSDEDDIMISSPIANPRSYHKGLLRVVSTSANISPSKIPRRKSSTSTTNGYSGAGSSMSSSRKNSFMSASTDRLHMRRDSHSMSPKRKPKTSIDIGGSMIDLGVTPSRSMNRISKPTTLSPIVGTPNKDCEQDYSSCGNDATNRKCTNDSPTKIPIRRSSSININGSRMGSRNNSRGNSREPSPPKMPASKPSSKIPQKVNQKGSPSKAAKKGANESNKSGSTRSSQSNLNKEASSAKKEPAINREKSSVKKVPAATIKREPSTLKRQPSNIKRESSQQTLKRENSTIGLKQSKTKSEQASTLLKNQSDSSLAKRLEKKGSFKQKRRTSSESDGLNEIDTANLSDKLIPLTKTNGAMMTTSVIASQPVQITAAVTDQLNKTNSSGQIVINDNSNLNSDSNNNDISSSSNVIDANSSGKVTNDTTNVSETTNAPSVSSVKTQEVKTQDAGASATASEAAESANGAKTSEKEALTADAADSSANDAHTLQKKASTRTLGAKSDVGSVLGTPISIGGGSGAGGEIISQNQIDSEPISSAIETKVNVIDSAVTTSADSDKKLKASDMDETHRSEHSMAAESTGAARSTNVNQNADNVGQDNNGIGSHIDPSTGVKKQMSENGDADSDDQITCCKLCKCCTPCYASALCLPCRRLRKINCCKRAEKVVDEQKEAVATILNETETKARDSCWKRMKCCNRKAKDAQKKIMDEVTSIEQQTMQTAQSMTNAAKDTVEKERGKCGMCLAKVFCCRKTNKVRSTSDVANADDVQPGCCSCLPCRRKAKEPMAWAEQRHDSLMSNEHMPKKGCCARLCERLACCRKKEVVESRRTSMNSKKQSIAPTLPPEDTRPKIDESLVDHTSVMKAAIPVLPVGLAWFCLICNCLIPGFGTICSGIFCLCLGIPRFSQHDGARARIGSFLVNTIVGVAQAFTLIFCLVGWGWSIWWGMIMLRTAKKHRKILQSDETDLEEAQTIASHSTTNQPQNHRDIEAGRNRN